MPGNRSRRGCEECRRRKRKCDEVKPDCGPCVKFGRHCDFELKVQVISGTSPRKSKATSEKDNERQTGLHRQLANDNVSFSLPRSLPNGISLPAKYRLLLTYFTDDILASLSVHTSIHTDLRQGLVPFALESPQLLSACLALAAAGLKSRGVKDIDGTDITRVLDHLQSSGLSLLRLTLGNGQATDALLMSCLIWCLADIFAAGQGTTSWRVHLRGMKALLTETSAAYGRIRSTRESQGEGHMAALRHLYQLYLALETLPYVPGSKLIEAQPQNVEPSEAIESVPCIDGFLGYSVELLYVLKDIDRVATNKNVDHPDPGILLAKIQSMVERDEKATPTISISTPLSPDQIKEFHLCHRVFLHATLVHLYRRLYKLPSASKPIREAIQMMETMIEEMVQDQSCHTWVAMAMPLFTMGCEAFTSDQKSFVLRKIARLDACMGSLHVGIIRKALEDMWRTRHDLEDMQGQRCADDLLEKLQYNIILF